MDRKNQLKELMKKSQQSRAAPQQLQVESPFAKYKNGELFCTACNSSIKGGNQLWNAHAGMKKHIDNVEQRKEEERKASLKLKHQQTQQPQPPQKKQKLDSNSTPGLPMDFFDSSSSNNNNNNNNSNSSSNNNNSNNTNLSNNESEGIPMDFFDNASEAPEELLRKPDSKLLKTNDSKGVKSINGNNSFIPAPTKQSTNEEPISSLAPIFADSKTDKDEDLLKQFTASVAPTIERIQLNPGEEEVKKEKELFQKTESQLEEAQKHASLIEDVKSKSIHLRQLLQQKKSQKEKEPISNNKGENEQEEEEEIDFLDWKSFGRK